MAKLTVDEIRDLEVPVALARMLADRPRPVQVRELRKLAGFGPSGFARGARVRVDSRLNVVTIDR